MRRALRAFGLPMVWLLLGLIRVYQFAISPMLGARCKFYPSCSAFGFEAVKTHGPLKGPALAVVRVCRCHPWQLGGLDPVPAKGAWRPEINPDGTPRLSAPTGISSMTHVGVKS